VYRQDRGHQTVPSDTRRVRARAITHMLRQVLRLAVRCRRPTPHQHGVHRPCAHRHAVPIFRRRHPGRVQSVGYRQPSQRCARIVSQRSKVATARRQPDRGHSAQSGDRHKRSGAGVQRFAGVPTIADHVRCQAYRRNQTHAGGY